MLVSLGASLNCQRGLARKVTRRDAPMCRGFSSDRNHRDGSFSEMDLNHCECSRDLRRSSFLMSCTQKLILKVFAGFSLAET
jgi:hypothetical protein